MTYSCNRILLHNKNEQTTDTHKEMDTSQKYYAELKKSDTKEYILNYFTYETNKTSKAKKVNQRKIRDCLLGR